MTNLKNKVIALSLLLAGALALCLSADVSAAKKNAESLDSIVAVVNDSIITQSELDEALQNIRKQMAAGHTPAPPAAVLRKKVLEQLVDRKLQTLLAEAGGIQITDDQVDKAIASIAENNKITVQELYGKVTSSGVDTKDYRKEIREEMLTQQVQQHEVGSKISITPQEVDDMIRSASFKAYYNKEYHLEDILIALPEAPSPQALATAKKQADAVLAKLHRGKSFSEVAVEESGNQSALQGGDMGWLKLPQIPPNFANELVHMKVNDIMGPVATPNGYHIVRLAGLRETHNTMDAATQRKQVEQLLYQRKLEEGLQSWITKLRSESFINTNPESLA